MDKTAEEKMDPRYKQMLDDVFDAFTMLAGGSMVSMMHVQGNVTRWSPSAVELFDLSGEYIENGSMDWGDYVHPEDRKRYMDVMGHLLDGGNQTYDLTYRVRIKGGEYVSFRVIGAVLRDTEGDPSMIGGMMVNQGMTENTDPVTVLPNKNAYIEKLSELLNSGKHSFSLLVGLSKMSEINRMHGYTYGNRLLQEIAWMIQETVKGRGEVYRSDGPTFIVLSDTLSREEIGAIYDMIRYRMQRGIQVNGIRNIISANAGLVAARTAEINADTIFSCLVYAYRESKDHMHGELVDFNGSINYEGSESLEKMNSIRDSILDDCSGFSMIYEPVYAVQDEVRKGAEAHVVWESETYGTVSAEEFLPVLERDFVFEELGDFMMRRAFSDAQRFREKDPGFLLCVNIYRMQMESDYFIDDLLSILEETHFPAEQLSLKLTSDCRYLEIARVRDIIEKLHEKKIIVIIDGFGSGADSIIFLKHAPVDAVCLDTQFVSGIQESSRDHDILEHLTKMAATCVEHINVKGVDSRELRDILRTFPVTTMQGAYFGGTRTADELYSDYSE